MSHPPHQNYPPYGIRPAGAPPPGQGYPQQQGYPVGYGGPQDAQQRYYTPGPQGQAGGTLHTPSLSQPVLPC